jgi:hypothetical protein
VVSPRPLKVARPAALVDFVSDAIAPRTKTRGIAHRRALPCDGHEELSLRCYVDGDVREAVLGDAQGLRRLDLVVVDLHEHGVADWSVVDGEGSVVSRADRRAPLEGG